MVLSTATRAVGSSLPLLPLSPSLLSRCRTHGVPRSPNSSILSPQSPPRPVHPPRLNVSLALSPSLSLFDSTRLSLPPRLSLSVTPSLPLRAGRVLVPRDAEREVRYDGVICQGLMCPGKREGMLVAALKSRYFRHRCYRCFLHSVSSVTINEVTDQSAAVVDDATPASLCSPWTIPRRHGFAANRFHIVRDPAPNGTEGVIVSPPRGTIHGGDFAIRDVITNPSVPSERPG